MESGLTVTESTEMLTFLEEAAANKAAKVATNIIGRINAFVPDIAYKVAALWKQAAILPFSPKAPKLSSALVIYGICAHNRDLEISIFDPRLGTFPPQPLWIRIPSAHAFSTLGKARIFYKNARNEVVPVHHGSLLLIRQEVE